MSNKIKFTSIACAPELIRSLIEEGLIPDEFAKSSVRTLIDKGFLREYDGGNTVGYVRRKENNQETSTKDRNIRGERECASMLEEPSLDRHVGKNAWGEDFSLRTL